ncbi:MAG TPA: choice-of-anchor L domain-containing protein, partial [Bacteroidia bacterium]|nr:choice-of-anchor L domain-containing protein [Bacteroidia bacterium]
MKKSLLLFVCVSFISMLSDAQLIVSRKTPYNSNTYLVNSVLLGNGVIATGITYTGDDTAIGFFNGIKSALGMDSGIMLTNGAITDGPGPLWSDQPSGSPGYSWPNCTTYTDPDLAKIAGVTVTSSAILQFDFVPASDSIKFTFVFASHEYPEFVNSFNDAFGFFLSGPGIAGPFTSSAENIALIPSTGKPITINSVNYDSNCAYYVCNDYTTSTYPYASLSTCTGPCPNQHQDSVSTLGYGGYTIPITASALVQCGKQYHIKIGICNAGDCAYSSAVFIKAGSFNSSFINVSPSKSVYTCPSGSPINLVATGAGSYTW